MKKIGLILCYGDLINTGGSSYGSIGKAFWGFQMLFIDKIRIPIDLPKSDFIFTIGNHDLNRSADSKI